MKILRKVLSINEWSILFRLNGAYIWIIFFKCYRSNNEENRGELIKKDSLLRSQGFNTTNITIPDSETDFNVYVYGGVISSVFVFGLLRALMYFKVAVDAAKHLHNRMFRRLLRVPIRFFDTNPVGKSMKDILRQLLNEEGFSIDFL